MQKVECGTHGEAYPTYVCGQLAKDPRQRWYCDYPSDENHWPDAWCGACDREFQKEGEWNERNEQALSVTMICHHCYEEARGSSVAPQMEARSESWQPFLAAAISELRAKQDRLRDLLDLWQYDRWDWDQGTGEIVFSSAGKPELIARIQFVGSVSTVSDTWLWSWANDSFETRLVDEMLTVRSFGETEDYACLNVPKWPAEEVDGWEMTAVAAKLLEAEGAYRTPDDNGATFMTLKEIRRAQ